ncbi:MAG: M23 family metallopeptidase [Candidatus Nitricoxidivorans perseverans]|uniref:M23 family metallopeptidase n=1 Tax=Candidatus Nitricoxidivorans perseverans TaxID=2975601 RepID=A0AA49FKF7_9PROT|nr:MAG: M23 family metallopeptidase [Candidatus Nitricoxidivorans perseverans]
MHIILVSDRLATAKTITVTGRHVLLTLAMLSALIIGLSSLFSYVTVRHAAEIRLPFLQELLRTVSAEETQKSREFVKENLNAMAVKLGQMQAQVMRLDSMGERLAAMAGVKPQELKSQETVPAAQKDGRGGPLVSPPPLSAEELEQALESLSREVDVKKDILSLLESRMFDERIRRSLLPSTLPVEAQWNASGFGWRVDPFTGETALHEGIDFVAEPGTPIKAAAAGVVTAAEAHPQYGNMIEIDHGNDMTTRYAHASRIHVQAGALVKRGQMIAEVGSTGRSTGPHLHFEVRVKGIAQNPNRFLRQAQVNDTKLARK